jgi:hypothetical protein
MSTKLIHFGLTWNLSNNSKSVRNQKKLQLQKLFKIRAGNVNAMPRLNTTAPRTFKGPIVPTGLVRALSTVSTPPSPRPRW